jgi:uncharacterized protein YndB with AHSA1/START domain
MQNTSTISDRQSAVAPAIQTINIVKERTIAAPLAIVWEAMLEEIGPGLANLQEQTMNMKLEPWPGGRYFRDLGDGVGHLWGHVQVIKPPTLLEIVGPMFMSYPVSSHVQYRLSPENDRSTRLTLTHRAFGMIDPEHAQGVQKGWQRIVDRITQRAGKSSR